MAVRRKLTSIRLDKIAAVDKPCQEHAVVAIVKRAPAGPVPPAIAKKTFDEALRAQLVSEKISDTFWRAFENQWAVRDAFRTALTDEIAEGGDGTDAVSGFSTAMQQIAVLAAEAAREAAGTAEPDLEAAVESAISKWLNEQPTQQEQTMHKFITKAALQAAITKFDVTKATAQDVADIKDSAVALNETGVLPATGVLAITVTTADPELPVLKRRLDVAEMAPAIRKHYDSLDEAGQTAFIAKDAAGRQAEVDAIEKGDPVVYTCEDGTLIRKSDGTAALMMAKRLDAQDKVIKGLREEGTATSIEKRAAAYPNVAKAVATDLLKSLDQVGADSEAGKAITKSLETMNKGQSALFKPLGTTEGGDSGQAGGDLQKARSTFDGKVTEIAKRDNIGRADAMSKARTEFADLYTEAYPAPAEEEA
jgi:hypothetical protein